MRGDEYYGDDSDDDEDEDEEDEDEDDSQCTDDQKAIAKEYGDENKWPCDVFVDAVTSGDGTDGHDFGYLTGAYQGGRDAILSEMAIAYGINGYITSDWRCPIGNAAVGGVANSQHKEGTAGDFTAAGFDVIIHGHFATAALGTSPVWNSSYGTGTNQYTGHIHIHW